MNVFFLRLAEETIIAYLASLASILLADSASLTSIGTLKAAAIAAIPAALAAVKGLLARYVGDPASPSLVTK